MGEKLVSKDCFVPKRGEIDSSFFVFFLLCRVQVINRQLVVITDDDRKCKRHIDAKSVSD